VNGVNAQARSQVRTSNQHGHKAGPWRRAAAAGGRPSTQQTQTDVRASGSAKEAGKLSPLQQLSEHLRLVWGQERPPERPLRKCQAGLARVCLWHPSTLCRKPALCSSGTQRPISLEPRAWVTARELSPGGLGSLPHPPPHIPQPDHVPGLDPLDLSLLRCSLKASPAAGLPSRICPQPTPSPQTMGPLD